MKADEVQLKEQRNAEPQKDEQADSRILKRLLVVSAVIHILVFVVDPEIFMWNPRPQEQEIVISADIFPDIEMGASKQTALPNAAPAEELMVDKNILPQLPNKFQMEEQAQKKDEMAVEEEEKPKDEPKPAEEEKPKPKEDEPDIVQKKNDALTELKKQDALERLLKEQTRREEKFADDTSAPLSDKLAQRKMELEGQQAGLSGGGGIEEIRLNKYLMSLSRVVRRNYSLPQIYNLQNAELEVRVAMMLNESGELRELDIAKSSGDPSFDELVLKVIRDSVPLPRPPTELSGQKFIFIFSPRTM